MSAKRIVAGFGAFPTSADVIALRLGTPDIPGDIRLRTLQASLRRRALVPSELGIDILTVGLAVYGADLSVSRTHDGDDGWTRHLHIDVEVREVDRWSAAAEALARALRFLTNDVWTFSFRRRDLTDRDLGFSLSPLSRPRFETERLALFSGGLDSTIGAIDLLADSNPIALISISGERTTSSPQLRLQPILATHFPDVPLLHIRQHVRIPRAVDGSYESSQRGRSFLFLAFALLVASCYGHHIDVIVPENGLIALNVPVDATRMGSNSTKTTHPFFLSRMRELVRCLGLNVDIQDPYRFTTKGEMIRDCRNAAALAMALPLTVSCAKAPQLFRKRGNSLLHCGACPACLIRRAAVRAGYAGTDPTPGYAFVSDLSNDVSATQYGLDIRAFKAAAARVRANPDRAAVDVYRSGPLTDVRASLAEYADVYRRGMVELDALLHDARTIGG